MIRVSASAITVLLFVTIAATAQETSSAASGNFQISGTAVNAIGGQPVARVKISIISTSDDPAPNATWNTSDQSVLQSMITAGDGKFVFKDVPEGKYLLIAESRAFYRQLLDSHESFYTAVIVGPQKDSENIVFKLHPEGAIFGRVTDESGEPVRDGSVMLFRKGVESGDMEIRMRNQVALDDQGMFSFTHIQEGTFFVAVNARPWYAQHNNSFPQQRGFGPQATAEPRAIPGEAQNATDIALDVAYPITFYPGTTDADSAEAITMHPGDRFSADMSVHPVAALHLRVNDRAQVNLSQRVFGDVRIPTNTQTMSGRAGTREIVGVAPGSYDISIRNFDPRQFNDQIRQNARAVGEIIASSPLSGRQRVNITTNGELDLADEPGAVAVTGIVKFEGKDNLANRGSISFRNREASLDVSASISKTGELQRVTLPPGKYALSRLSAEGLAISNISATGAKVTGRTIEIKGPGPVQLTIITASGLGRVEGTVMRDGKPVGGAMVVLVPQDPVSDRPLFRRFQSDSDGTFTAVRVLPGKYTVVAIEDGWNLEWANPEVLRPYLANGEPLEIKPLGKYKATVKVQ
jgi:hypothetical protein